MWVQPRFLHAPGCLQTITKRHAGLREPVEFHWAPPFFSPSVGLLLRDDLHHAYDRLEWSLYLKVSHLESTAVCGQGLLNFSTNCYLLSKADAG